MIVHNVLFKLDPDLPQAEIDRLGDAFISMKQRIDTIRDVSWHDNISKETRDMGFLHLLRVTFDDQAGLDAYVPHPYHAEVCEQYLFSRLKSDVDHSVLVFDHTL